MCFSYTNNKGSQVSYLGKVHPFLSLLPTYKMKGLDRLTSGRLPIISYSSRDLPKSPQVVPVTCVSGVHQANPGLFPGGWVDPGGTGLN